MTELEIFGSSARLTGRFPRRCRNWFYKTACIRELLPRFYVEVALLKCYEFLSDGEFPAILGRLGSIARGVGDPLVGVYARCYLAKVGADVAPACKPYAVTMLHDYLFCFKEVRREPFASRLQQLGLSDGQYIRLGEPAVEWVLRCIGRGASYEHFETVVAHYRDYCNDATVLAHIVDAFDAASVAKHPLGVVNLAKQAEPSRVTTVALLGRLGRRFAECPPPPHQRLAVLNEVWKVAARAGKERDMPNFEGSSLGRFPLVSADFWTSDHLSERSRSVDAFLGTRARGTLTLKRRRITLFLPRSRRGARSWATTWPARRRGSTAC